MSDENRPEPLKKQKPKNWKHINASCKTARLSDGYAPKDCPRCGTNNKLKKCPFCGYVRGKK